MDTLSYQAIRSRKRGRTISLQIKEDGKIVTHVPHRLPKREVERFVKEKQSWIVEKISEKGSI
ncbi:MAG: hypothetical protein A2V86_10795 [Deltaproteobacteria bacterium RBG_16_49_23]|nr:MAG: hypothetical protein A2V86_10795 [Deltaproteobacteria bacterium RBG_16_49_23]